MAEKRVDLHIHTTASDGQESPQEVVQRALEKNLAAIAITDHDSVAAIDPAVHMAHGTQLEIIPGVELGIYHHRADVHLLGYLVDHRAPAFLRQIRLFQQARYRRGQKIVSKLNQLGVDLQMDTVLAIAGEAPLGRPHVADALVREEYVHSYGEAFARYLGYHAPAYVPKLGLSAQEAIDLIHSVHGVAVLAHPGILDRDDLIPQLVDMGLDGLEAFHYKHDLTTRRHYVQLAHQHGLIFTGGSDCHGSRFDRGTVLGKAPVPYHCVIALKKRKRWLQSRHSGLPRGESF
jgi:predicted metal-dependent phosphoesterase TrpH